MERMNMQTGDGAKENVERLGRLFPGCVTETKDENGRLRLSVDFDKQRQELSNEIAEETEERYRFTWPDKKKAIELAGSPITAALRPCREESADFYSTKNLNIDGDNLDALKCLKDTYSGKVKMIYVDPPHNTGNDFVHNDDLTVSAEEYKTGSGRYDSKGNRLVANPESNGRFHTDWLNMIYLRLKIAKDFLTDDGVIFISIDDNEVENLRKVCDEIFGESIFVGDLVLKTATDNNPSQINIEHEFMLCH